MKAVIYVRVSTNEQVGNHSLESQQRSCEEFCDREGFSVAQVFVEEGESAKTADRPRLQEALEFCRVHRKEINNFVVYNVSRFARNMADHSALRLALHKLGIRLRAASEQFDDTASGKLVENMLAVIAQFDNDQRAAGTITGMKTALAKGRWTHQPPLGYQKPITKAVGTPSLVRDPERAPLIQLAFERMSTGRFSKAHVLEEVTSLGLLTKRGAPLPA